ncbi:MAG TPA: DEAD/DEAH box helicase [Xanthomonadales bacterium]|nr:DEAD/DEAH box helicase [Xanthomonadales bacterium]
MPLTHFHPAVSDWFTSQFAAPTAAQLAAWAAIRRGRHTLVAAPTGSGKTLAAFLQAIDGLVRAGLDGSLSDQTTVLYVSPLKALSNDINLNLLAPLAGIAKALEARGLPSFELRSMVRTGDTPQSERVAMRKRPPHILVTTPESLYILLGSESGRSMLASVRSVIVDEIHAVVESKRGAHLALSLARLEALTESRVLRVGLSATQSPIVEVARFLIGSGAVAADGTPDCEIVDTGHVRRRDLALELGPQPLGPVMSGLAWEQIYDRLAVLGREHRTTLVFVNTRRMVERVTRHLSERLGSEWVAAHHGSLSKELRLNAEQRLKAGQLKLLVATASLELGIDIGDVDLVCQLGSPGAISAFLQRVGRSGHAVGALPKGRLFPLSRDDLVECAALLDCVRRGELDQLEPIDAALDVLAQQMVAEVAARDCSEDELYAMMRRAWPYARLPREDFDAVLRMLTAGFTPRRGPRAAYIHRDAVNSQLRARRGARLTAISSGGAIPDNADYQVILEPDALMVGSVHEDFAVESMAGDIFQLGNISYRVLRIEQGKMRVESAAGLPPTVPFWLGEAPGRSDALSLAISRLREQSQAQLELGQQAGMQQWLIDEMQLDLEAASQLADYLARTHLALGTLPTQDTLVMERFFDESGGTQLVIHSPYGSRFNRAWGLALRKRFCRRFNFELQAAATEDAIVISLSTSHSFPLEDVGHYLHSNSVAQVLTQALLDAPMFGVRWRWNATTALALPRMSGGKKTPAPIQRMRAEDLVAAVFPDQIACAENLAGEREIPDHPLVRQTLHDCLHEAMDLNALIALLKRLERGEAQIECRELTTPSPLAAEVLSARPYAFLDDAPLEERRTQAVQQRRWNDIGNDSDYAQLDEAAIDAVREEAWPQARDADEMHDALFALGWVSVAEASQQPGWTAYLEALAQSRRATQLLLVGPDLSGGSSSISANAPIWVVAERLNQFDQILPGARRSPPTTAPDAAEPAGSDATAALVEIIRGRMAAVGPVLASQLAAALGMTSVDIELALLALEGEGYVMRGQFSRALPTGEQWCERHLLARIHRYTIKRLRREIEPVEPRDVMRFLFAWQRVGSDRTAGPDALASVLAQLEGFEAPAEAWEAELLTARVADYEPAWLDDLCLAGRVLWTRQRSYSHNAAGGASGPVRNTPIVLLQRKNLSLWQSLREVQSEPYQPTSRAQKVVAALTEHGAMFFDELTDASHLLAAELENALGELVAVGLVHCDSYAGLRALLMPAAKRAKLSARRGRGAQPWSGLTSAGRWALVRRPAATDGTSVAAPDPEKTEQLVRVLLRRYGLLCFQLLQREAGWLPPWRVLVRACQRLEARGELRGGRFIAGLTGEQFALPEVIAQLRGMRNSAPGGLEVCLSAADPLNLVGTLLTGTRIGSLASSRVLYRDGLPIASLVGGEVQALVSMTPGEQWHAKTRLLRTGSLESEAQAHFGPTHRLG